PYRLDFYIRFGSRCHEIAAPSGKSGVKYLGLFDADKNEERVRIEGLDDIFAHADRLKLTAVSYDAKASSKD
ncbi:hypothetical protein, partial [Magnetospirillum moscoviense]|uniref:hypothetical protein n=1 Tax=Magnetospirillum moscoviense TaxID=1437059 RepID=UPI001C12C718